MQLDEWGRLVGGILREQKYSEEKLLMLIAVATAELKHRRGESNPESFDTQFLKDCGIKQD